MIYPIITIIIGIYAAVSLTVVELPLVGFATGWIFGSVLIYSIRDIVEGLEE